MSLDMAIGQIDQIIDLQQQLADPSELASTLASGGVGSTGSSGGAGVTSSGGAGLTTGTSDAAFADMLAASQASTITGTDGDTTSEDTGLSPTGLSDSLLQALTGTSTTPTTGLDSTTPTTGLDSTTPATGLDSTTPTTGLDSTTGLTGLGATTATDPDASSRIQAMVNEANSLIGKPYVWGGGHSGWGSQTGYDCSGFVSAVLHAGGYLSSPQDTQTLPDQPGIENGPGQYVTIYDRTDAGAGDDHVIIDIGGQFYESGGEHGSWGGGGGVEKIATPSQAYLSTFNRTLHPEGL